VKLSPKGKALIDAAFAEDMRVEADMLAPLDRSERKELARLLARLLVHLEGAEERS
jgi:DNA-binding MarR family transcriptional regulator